MRKLLLLTAVVAFTVSLCMSQTSTSAVRSGKSMSALDREAMSIVKENYFDRRFTLCGDSYLAQQKVAVMGNFIEMKVVSSGVDSPSVTEADRMNGFEWKGMVWINSKFVRYHSPSFDGSRVNLKSRKAGWGPWREVTGHGVYLDGVYLEKQNGKWKPSVDDLKRKIAGKKADCSLKNDPVTDQ